MIKIRRSEERGHANFGWLDSHHSFSFGHYYDPDQMGFGHLRVINDDRVSPGRGFDPHGHQDMEIVSYVLTGELEHRDSIGNGSVIRPGDVQRMTAGTGIRHSEYNHSKADEVHFLQIWVMPAQDGLAPGYEQKHFGDERNGRLRLVASREARDGSVQIHQDLDLYASILQAGEEVTHRPETGRQQWVQVARGEICVNGEPLQAGDGAAISGESVVALATETAAEILLFDMPA